MSSIGVASGRFHRAFYEWTLLTSIAETGPAKGCIRGFYNESRAHKATKIRRTNQKPKGDNVAHRSPEQHKPSLKHVKTKSGGQRDIESRVQKPELSIEEEWEQSKSQKVIKRWKTGPVMSAVEKPLSSLKPFEAVVRFRSNYGVMIEVAVVEDVLQREKMKWGPRMEGLSLRSDAQIEIQKLKSPPAIRGDSNERNHIFSILISGTYEEAYKAYSELGRLSNESSAPLSKDAPKIEIFSPLARPASSLTPREMVFRQRKGQVCILEFSILESDFMKFTSQSSLETICYRYNVIMAAGDPELRPIAKDSSETGRARSLIVKGLDQDVVSARFHVLAILSDKSREAIIGPQLGTTERSAMRAKIAAFSEAQASTGTPADAETGTTYLTTAREPNTATGEETHMKATAPTTTSPPEISEQTLGLAANDYRYCLVKIVGQNPSELLQLLRKDSRGDRISQNGRDGHVGVQLRDADLSIVGRPDHIRWFLERRLRPKMEILWAKHKLGRHQIETNDSPIRDVVGKRQSDRVSQLHIQGPNAKDLWRIVMEEYDEGYRAHVSEVVLVKKERGALSFIGARYPVNAATSRFEERVKVLCEHFGYPEHKVSNSVAPANPALAAELVDQARGALRTLTHPAVVITSRLAQEAGRTKEILPQMRGATVSSFNAVTLTPTPIVSFNLKLPSRTWDAIKISSRLIVHILKADARGAAIADAFTRAYPEPNGGFLKVQEMGMSFTEFMKPPGSKWCPALQDDAGGGILCGMKVDLLPEKCVEVEDHVIVVGKVRSCKQFDAGSQSFALSYAMRAYRGDAVVVEPDSTRMTADKQSLSNEDRHDSQTQGLPSAGASAAEFELDPLLLGENNDSPGAALQEEGEKFTEAEAAPLLDDPIWNSLASARDHVKREQEMDLYMSSGIGGPQSSLPPGESAEELGEDGQAAEAAEEDEYDHGVGEPEESSAADNKSKTASMGNSRLSDHQSQHRRAFSTYARPLATLEARQTSFRSISTFTSSNETAHDLAHMLDPSIAQATVSDYLTIRDDSFDSAGRFIRYPKQRNVRAILVARKHITRLHELLARGYKVLDRGQEISLTDAEISQMQRKIILLERQETVTLALNAMWHLRVMLDKARYGEYFWRKVPVMESLVEKGMKCLLDQARELRQRLDEGRVSKEEYEKASQLLRGKYGGMETEVQRLRQVTEEEGEGGMRDGYGDDDD